VQQPDERLNGGFGGPHGRVTFSSYRPSLLRAAQAAETARLRLADDVIGETQELRRAAEIYPFGYDIDVDRPVEPLSAEALEQWKRDWTGFALGSQFFRIEMRRTATSSIHSSTRFGRTHGTRTGAPQSVSARVLAVS
jgi:hypothetical protein